MKSLACICHSFSSLPLKKRCWPIWQLGWGNWEVICWSWSTVSCPKERNWISTHLCAQVSPFLRSPHCTLSHCHNLKLTLHMCLFSATISWLLPRCFFLFWLAYSISPRYTLIYFFIKNHHMLHHAPSSKSYVI